MEVTMHDEYQKLFEELAQEKPKSFTGERRVIIYPHNTTHVRLVVNEGQENEYTYFANNIILNDTTSIAMDEGVI